MTSKFPHRKDGRDKSLRIAAAVLQSVLITACGRNSVPETTYVGANRCVDCHAEQYAAWSTSDHALAMAEAIDSTVLAPFEGEIFSLHGAKARFYREEAGYAIDVTEVSGEERQLAVAYTFGYNPLQQYLVEAGDGRYQAFTTAWSPNEARWFSLYPDSALVPGDFVHWSGRGMNWNYMCAECHSTHLDKGYDSSSGEYETTFAEINVACEACHGPGSNHVEDETEKRARNPAYESERDSGPVRIVGRNDLDKLRQRSELDVCARCHSRRSVIDDAYEPGDSFLDHYTPALLDEGLYYPDGQIQDEVYVYGSFLQSRMYVLGVTCSDCHDVHSGKVRLAGNALCAQCHDPEQYDRRPHHGHLPDSKASQCVTCHMPERTYMQLDPRRDHSFKTPNPLLSAQLGTPDVCIDCHVDRSPADLDQIYRAWYPFLESRASDRIALAIHAGRAGTRGASADLNDVAGDRSVPPMLRATAASLLGRYPVQESLGPVTRELRSPVPIVRLGALAAVDALGDAVSPVVLTPLLTDSLRAIRVEAARLLAGRQTGETDAGIVGFSEALVEYVRSQEVNADQPESRINLAILAERRGDLPASRSLYEQALDLDSTFVPAHVNLGLLYDAQRRQPDRAFLETAGIRNVVGLRQRSLKHFRAAARSSDPAGARAQYYLGLVLAEDSTRLVAAADALESAANRLGDDSRVFYNAGLARQSLGQGDRAEALLKTAIELSPQDTDPLNALTILYMQQENWIAADRANNRLLGFVPGDRSLERRRAYIRDRLDEGEPPK